MDFAFKYFGDTDAQTRQEGQQQEHKRNHVFLEHLTSEAIDTTWAVSMRTLLEAGETKQILELARLITAEALVNCAFALLARCQALVT